MSVFSAEMTMQICSAPAAIILSTRYSETALGLSTPSMMRDPTGSNSLEQPSGWMRCPAPAAGIIPIIELPHGPHLVWKMLNGPLQNAGATVWHELRRCGHPMSVHEREQPALAILLHPGATHLQRVRCWPRR